MSQSLPRALQQADQQANVPWSRAARSPVRSGKLPEMQLALLDSELGDLDEAVQHLERAIEATSPASSSSPWRRNGIGSAPTPAVRALPGAYGS